MRHRKLIPIYFMYLLVAVYVVRHPLMGAARGFFRAVGFGQDAGDVTRGTRGPRAANAQDRGANTVREGVGNRRLILAQVFFRHGHTSPSAIYAKDPNPASIWKQPMKHLTKIGRYQNFKLGYHLRQLYWNFLSFNNKEVHCMSSGSERCISAARSVLESMYLQNSSQPQQQKAIPIRFKHSQSEKFFPSESTCQAAKFERDRILQTPESLQFIQKHRKLYEFLSEQTGETIWTYKSAGELFEILNAEKSAKLKIPNWALQTWKHLQYQADAYYHFRFKTYTMRRLMAGPILGLMASRMQEKATDPKQEVKAYLYSGTTSNLAVLQKCLGFDGAWTPATASYVALELYEGPEGDLDVRILHSTVRNPREEVLSPEVLILPGSTEYCPFKYFVEYVQHLVPKNWEEECLSGIKLAVLSSD